jgi:hypothetical protein
MKKLFSIISSAALVAVTSVAAIAPANAAPNWQRQRGYVANWCQAHPYDRDCRDFRRNSNRWGAANYNNWYQRHRTVRGFDPMAASIFGFAAGAIIGGAAASAARANSSSHVAACEARYRSYDVRSDTFLGYDGIRHRCTL